MRIKINFTESNVLLPINNQNIVNSYIHKCIGINNVYHDSKNDYCISMLCSGVLNDDKTLISYPNGCYITVSSLNMEFMNKLLIGIISNPNLYKDIKFKNIEHINEIFINGWNHFTTLSPFIIKEYKDKKNYSFLTIDNIDFEFKVKEYLINKLSKINPLFIKDVENFDIKIHNHINHKVKYIKIHNVKNLANKCQIDIKCTKQIAELLYNIGIGQSCGCGFGTIYKTENHKIYK
jgi:CRISPR-associated endoribonuclease Cas6